jgi:hypothetical protein
MTARPPLPEIVAKLIPRLASSEANALVVQPRKARKLCLGTILRYLHRGDPARYWTALKEPREELRREIMRYGWMRATHDKDGRYLIRPSQRGAP